MHSNIPQQNVTVSIILSESTASMLKANIPNLENCIENSETMVCSIKALQTSDIANFKDAKKKITEYFFQGTIEDSNLDNDKVTSEIAYISKNVNKSDSSIDIVDDLSEVLLQNNSSNDEEDQFVLDMVKIYTRPLVSMKTEAHKDNFIGYNNDLFLTVMDSELSVTNSGWINVCRICHGGESIGNLLSPCRCKGSIALTHLGCLERWLKESANSHCELCQHHFKIIREPKYSIPTSILVFLRHPGEHYKELLFDLLALLIYTPSAFASTYMLMLLCESIAKSNLQYNRNISAHIMAFSAIFGIAAIDFTYSSWLIVTLQKHTEAWKNWYKNNCQLKLILPPWRQRRHRQKRKHGQKTE